ncbi:MAG: hypothetical protein ABFC24_11190 [Methanoregulaceae archaeon]
MVVTSGGGRPTAHEFTGTPMSRLILFLVCLSIAGTLAAGVHYAAIDLPQHSSHQVPAKTGVCDEQCRNCMETCLQEDTAMHTACFTMCAKGSV